MKKERCYITTPIYYVNDQPHIGHAYTSVACDVMARFKRMQGFNVKFLTGTDEHGQKVEKSARAAGMTPQAFVDGIAGHFRDLTKLMQISNDDFIRTTEPRHIRTAQALWRRMQENGHIYPGTYAGWYAVRDEAYYAESELINGRAPTGAEVEWVEEPSYFFNLSQWQEKLLQWYDENPGFIAPQSRRNEVISFVKGGLKDLSISRTIFSWGIPIPDDDTHIMYVWLDALANYLSALEYFDNQSKEKDFWPANVHVIGKDILRFHAVYWPAFLMAAALPLPKKIFAHGWWTIDGEKMSKSLGNAIAPAHLVETYGLDSIRWFFLREMPFGNDGNFSREAVIARVNSELANTIGNLAQRTLSLVEKHCGGKTPLHGELSPEEERGLYAEEEIAGFCRCMEDLDFSGATNVILAIAVRANQYIDAKAPWKLKKENPQAMEHVLYVLLEYLRIIAILLQPFIPQSSSKLLRLLGIEEAYSMDKIGSENSLVPGMEILPPEMLFPRLQGD